MNWCLVPSDLNRWTPPCTFTVYICDLPELPAADRLPPPPSPPPSFFSVRGVQKHHANICRKKSMYKTFTKQSKKKLPGFPWFFVLSRFWVFLSEGKFKNTILILQTKHVERFYKNKRQKIDKKANTSFVLLRFSAFLGEGSSFITYRHLGVSRRGKQLENTQPGVIRYQKKCLAPCPAACHLSPFWPLACLVASCYLPRGWTRGLGSGVSVFRFLAAPRAPAPGAWPPPLALGPWAARGQGPTSPCCQVPNSGLRPCANR
jgi:hypothetical protein